MALADGSFYRPNSKVYDHPENHGLRVEDVLIPSGGGVALHGWFFKARDPIGTIVHCHGNSGNITGHFKFTHWLPECGWNVLCFDYRGYGRSTGKVTRQGLVDDASAAIEYAIGRPDVDRLRVCVLGQSMGASVSIVAMAREGFPLAGLCLDGPYSAHRREARFVLGQSWLLRPVSGFIARYLISDGLSPIDFVSRLPNIPKLFICGTHDRIVDPQQTIDLYEESTDPKELWVIEGSGHTEAMRGEIDGGRERVLRFFNQCVPNADAPNRDVVTGRVGR